MENSLQKLYMKMNINVYKYTIHFILFAEKLNISYLNTFLYPKLSAPIHFLERKYKNSS